MKKGTKIHLWVTNEGWQEFNLSDSKELEQRDISIGDGAIIGNLAIIGNEVTIGNRARIGYRATIGDGITPKIIGINGSKHFVNYWGEDTIQIGCEKHTIQEWIDNFEQVGKSEGYTTEQIAEYVIYIKIIVELHKTWAI